MSDLQRARAVFEQQHAQGRFPGGQLVVWLRGEKVLDVALGKAREPSMAVTPATRFAVFSATKPVVATAIAMMEERGLVDVNAPVAKYWPEFAANGKGELTVLDVLRHRAGVLTPELVLSPERWGDEQHVRSVVASATPRSPRGKLAYMPYEFGWILAEVAQRATGERLDTFLAREIAAPLGVPGLRFGATRDELATLAQTYWVGTKKTYVAGVELSAVFERDNNSPAALTAFVPGAGLVCTANDLARFYDALARGGAPLLKPSTLARYTEGAWGFDRSNRVPLRVGRGFILGGLTPTMYGWWGTGACFGHAGAFCTLAWADAKRQLAVAMVTNGNAGQYDLLYRCAPLGSALQRAAA
ncbi:MAG: beta-lactamase family protein [Myxococcaceae bacterium]|nr:beta-lactamase family protein [Myxococcaceae bacterium]